MTVTIDLNVVLDVYLLRGDFESAMSVLTRCKRGEITGNIPSHGVPTIYYILKRSLGGEKARDLCKQLLDVLEVVPVDKEILLDAQKSSIVDFEDAIVEVAAYRASSNLILTNNIRDFALSRIPVLTPAQFLLQA